MSISIRALIVAVGLGFIVVSGVPAQVVTTAQLLGTIVDSQGLPMQRARIIAANEQTGATFTAESNEIGNYLLRALPVGRYTLSAEAAGFKRFIRKGIELMS